jgi:hypothetical protein
MEEERKDNMKERKKDCGKEEMRDYREKGRAIGRKDYVRIVLCRWFVIKKGPFPNITEALQHLNRAMAMMAMVAVVAVKVVVVVVKARHMMDDYG